MKLSKLVIVSGATGSLGEEYLRFFSKEQQFFCIGFARNKSKTKIKNVKYIYSDLLNSKATKEKINKIKISIFSEIIFIHPVGKFKFKFTREPEVDDEIFQSNVSTFFNILNPLKESLQNTKTKLVLCAFGSISDKYNVPFWYSYTKAKNKLREMIKQASSQSNVRSVFINVSTTHTKEENKLRPKADKTYWLDPKKVVQGSAREIISGKKDFTELNIFEPSPDFEQDYYLNQKKIKNKWKKEMGK